MLSFFSPGSHRISEAIFETNISSVHCDRFGCDYYDCQQISTIIISNRCHWSLNQSFYCASMAYASLAMNTGIPTHICAWIHSCPSSPTNLPPLNLIPPLLGSHIASSPPMCRKFPISHRFSHVPFSFSRLVWVPFIDHPHQLIIHSPSLLLLALFIPY